MLDGDEWVINGQKVWTSLAHVSHWCFVVARTEPGSQRHKGLSFLLVPMDQPGVETRPIVQITGGGEFNETFFTDAVHRRRPDRRRRRATAGAWRWACSASSAASRRSPSRSASTASCDDTIDLARRRGLAGDPVHPPAAGRAPTSGCS